MKKRISCLLAAVLTPAFLFSSHRPYTDLRHAKPITFDVNLAERIVKRAILQRMVWHAGLYLASYAVIALGTALLLSLGLYPAMPDLPWAAVYVLALLGAVLSLRHKVATVLFYLLLAAIVAALLASWAP